jgi:hypothetical protein
MHLDTKGLKRNTSRALRDSFGMFMDNVFKTALKRKQKGIIGVSRKTNIIDFHKL